MVQSETDLVKTLTSYVPGLVLRRLAADPSPPAEPMAERFAAAVLFADITGFTALAEQIDRQGIVGSENLARLVNNYFSQVIDIVYRHGGEIAKFAGDALLALWPVVDEVARLDPALDEQLQKMTHRAAQCGLAIQRELDQYVTEDGRHLSLQVGIGAGDVYSVHLGGVFNRWEFLLSGSPLIQMILAKERAQPGAVVLSPEAWSLIAAEGQADELDEGFVTLTRLAEISPLPTVVPNLPVETRRSLQAYIPAAVQSHLAAGHESWLSELRQVTILFIKLPSYGTSIKHPYARTIPQAQAVMQALQAALYRYAGSINKLNVDDKGITLVAAMGLPPLSHREDAILALRAALEMQEALEALGRRSAIGLTTGWVFCGPVGNRQRREYTMVGNVVNLAARLMQVAESHLTHAGTMSETFCDEVTYRAVQEQLARDHPLAAQIGFEKLPKVQVKGKSEAVQIYRPQLRRHIRRLPIHHQTGQGRIVGRLDEQSFLQACLEALGSSAEVVDDRILIVEGEAGIGKSLLVGELLAQANRMRLNVLVGGGHVLEKTTAYYGWRTIFRQIFELDAFVGDLARQRSHVLRQMPAIREERGFPALAISLSPLLNSVLPLAFDENETTRAMPDKTRRETTHFLLLRLLQLATARGRSHKPPFRLLIMENGQWLDEETWRLLLAVSSQVTDLGIIIVTRPLEELAAGQPTAAAFQELLAVPGVRRIRVRSLDLAEMTTILCQQFKLNSVPDELVRLLYARTGGNPFFGRELMRAWQQEALVKINGRRCHLLTDVERLADTTVPEGVRKAIIGRLERLPPVYQLILKTASVLGPRFSEDGLRQVYPVSGDQELLSSHLQTLVELGFFDRDPVRPDAYHFKYTLIQEVIFELLPFTRRRRLLANI